MFLVWTPGTWGEQMFPGGHFFSVLATGGGRWRDEMANIGWYGLGELEYGPFWETRDGLGRRVSLPVIRE